MKTILAIIFISIGIILTQKHMYESNLKKLEKIYEEKISLISTKANEKEINKNPLEEKIELTNILIEDFQDDSLIKFNKTLELNHLILQKNNELLEKIKEVKCKK